MVDESLQGGGDRLLGGVSDDAHHAPVPASTGSDLGEVARFHVHDRSGGESTQRLLRFGAHHQSPRRRDANSWRIDVQRRDEGRDVDPSVGVDDLGTHDDLAPVEIRIESAGQADQNDRPFAGVVLVRPSPDAFASGTAGQDLVRGDAARDQLASFELEGDQVDRKVDRRWR